MVNRKPMTDMTSTGQMPPSQHITTVHTTQELSYLKIFHLPTLNRDTKVIKRLSHISLL
jgi:hypothetical protein